MDGLKTKFLHQVYFQSRLFNEIFYDFEEQLLPNLLQKYLLVPAKGGTRFTALSDMSYPLHILNGLYPGALMLEELLQGEGKNPDEIPPEYLKCFIVGFALHDLNKLSGIPELKDAIDRKLEKTCQDLQVEKFFPKWMDYLTELEFLILKTEEGTRDLANGLRFKDRDRRAFFHEYLAESCQLSDRFGGLKTSPDDIRGLYEEVNQINFKVYDRLSNQWKLSYVAVDKNIHTLLSQQLLKVVNDYLINEKQYRILFSLHQGTIFFGKPLNESDLSLISERFIASLKEAVDPIALTKITYQKCQFGFLNLFSIDQKIIEKIIPDNLGSLFYINQEEYLRNRDTVDEVFSKSRLPLRVQIRRDRKGQIEDYFVAPGDEWLNLGDEERKAILAVGSLKIKFLMEKHIGSWAKEWQKVKAKHNQILTKEKFHPNAGMLKTMGALLAWIDLIQQKSVEKVYQENLQDIVTKLNATSSTEGEGGLREFAQLYLTGNFAKPRVKVSSSSIPTRDKMCTICGAPASLPVNESINFGFGPRDFSPRSMNRLNVTEQHICQLCYLEILLRRTVFPEALRKVGREAPPLGCVYFDIGDYFIPIRKDELIKNLQLAEEFQIEERNGSVELNIEKVRMRIPKDYPLVFWNLPEDTKRQFNQLIRLLKFAMQLGFKVYVTDLMTPYCAQKEMFVFEKINPFAHNLDWERIRIDCLQGVLKEMELIQNIGSKQLQGLLLDYAEDRRALFTYFYLLDERKQRGIKNQLADFVTKRKEVFGMTTMEKLASLAADLQWRRGESMSSETWILRDSLEILRRCIQEGKRRGDVIQQIAGNLHKALKGKTAATPESLLSFAEALYGDLYEKEWNNRIPNPGRRKHYIYQFAFLYGLESERRMSKSIIEKAYDKLKAEGIPITKEAVLQKLGEDEKKQKHLKEYEPLVDEFIKATEKEVAEYPSLFGTLPELAEVSEQEIDEARQSIRQDMEQRIEGI